VQQAFVNYCLRETELSFIKIDDFNSASHLGKINIPQDSVRGAISQLKTDDDTGPIVLIKAYKSATYGNFVDILDEMNICGIARYTFVDIAWYEERMVESAAGILSYRFSFSQINRKPTKKWQKIRSKLLPSMK
jgi:hypothetical protein